MTNLKSSSSDTNKNNSSPLSIRLSGTSQTIAVIFWVLVTLISLVSLSLSIYSLNLWDRLPAADLPEYFPDISAENIKFLSDYKDTILQSGLSLTGYALIFSISRLLGGLSALAVGFLLIYFYSDRLIAVMMAIFLSVLAAAGIWYNLLFSWAVAIAPWMDIPVKVLGLLLWLVGALVIYTFPDGRFRPRWMVWLIAVVLPLAILLVLDIDIFLNPNHWPGPLYLLPNFLVIGGALFSILYRYKLITAEAQKKAIRWYIVGGALLAVFYLINLIPEIYAVVANQSMFQTNRAVFFYVILNEPMWYALVILFALGLALSVFRDQLLDMQAQQNT